MQYPNEEECKALLRTTKTTKFVYMHSCQVMQIALKIYDLVSPACQLDKQLIISGSLLHDITKARSLQTHEHHAETGEVEARKLGCDERICQVIGQHVKPKPHEGLTEVDVVCYADKRVTWDIVVTLKERVEDLKVRYGKGDQEKIKSIEDEQYGVNKVIEDLIGKYATLNNKADEFKKFVEWSELNTKERFKGAQLGELL